MVLWPVDGVSNNQDLKKKNYFTGKKQLKGEMLKIRPSKNVPRPLNFKPPIIQE